MISRSTQLLFLSALLLGSACAVEGDGLDLDGSGGSYATGAGPGAPGAGGFSTFPTGGAPGTSTGGGGSGGPAGSGYVVTGNWHGYAWVSAGGAGSTISPTDFSARPLDMPFPLCASGTVAADPDYAGTAMVGINLNQGTGATDLAGTVVPTGTGITVTVSNPGNSALRLQIQGPSGATNPADRWCAAIPEGGGTLRWSDFNTECWGSDGEDYAMQPLEAALVLVPGDNEAAVPFDFCLNSLVEDDAVVVIGTGGSPGSGGETATGGTPGSGGSVSTGGTSSGGGGGTPSYDGGYITLGPWHGYAFTATTGAASSISPAAFSVTAPPLCVSGSVAAGTANVAILGVNLNQPKGDNPPASTVVPTNEGMLVNVTNNGASPLRVQIQTAAGATNENARWCAPLSSGENFIPWSAFNTKCWDGSGTSFNPSTPIVSALILVPGAASARSFNFCLNDMKPAADPAGPGGQGCDLGGSPGTGSGTLSQHTGNESWAYVASNRYAVQNNVWNAAGAQHVLSYSGVSFTVTSQTGNQPTNGAPVSFPSVFIGSNYGRSTTGSNMPKQVSSLTTVPTGWSWSHGNSGEYNATYDVYFSTSAGGDAGSPSGGFLMVWLHKPTNAQPVGTSNAVASLAGRNWNVWEGTQHEGKSVISYVAQSSVTSLSFDLNDFIKHAVSRSRVQNNWYLTNIMAGFEIWSGGVNLKTNNFCAVIN